MQTTVVIDAAGSDPDVLENAARRLERTLGGDPARVTLYRLYRAMGWGQVRAYRAFERLDAAGRWKWADPERWAAGKGSEPEGGETPEWLEDRLAAFHEARSRRRARADPLEWFGAIGGGDGDGARLEAEAEAILAEWRRGGAA